MQDIKFSPDFTEPVLPNTSVKQMSEEPGILWAVPVGTVKTWRTNTVKAFNLIQWPAVKFNLKSLVV